MIRNVDLVSYLPPFLTNFKESTAALNAESIEFKIVWDSVNGVLNNEFIATADEYGISRFEKLLKILPSKEDTLVSRRARIQARWFNMVPHTVKAFISKLIALCGNNDFIISKKFDSYLIEIETALELFGQVEELEHIIENMIPCNIVVVSTNKIVCRAKGFYRFAGGTVNTVKILITNDFKEGYSISGDNQIGSGMIISEVICVKD